MIAKLYEFTLMKIQTIFLEKHHAVVKVVVDKFSSKPPPPSPVQNSPYQHILPHYWRQFGVRSIISPPEAATESQPFGHGLYTNDVFGGSCGELSKQMESFWRKHERG